MIEKYIAVKDTKQHISVIFHGQMACLPDLVYHWTTSCDKVFVMTAAVSGFPSIIPPIFFRKHNCKTFLIVDLVTSYLILLEIFKTQNISNGAFYMCLEFIVLKISSQVYL